MFIKAVIQCLVHLETSPHHVPFVDQAAGLFGNHQHYQIITTQCLPISALLVGDDSRYAQVEKAGIGV